MAVNAPSARKSGAGEGALTRVFPHDIEAERAVLGGVLVENEALGRLLEHISPEDFYRIAHKHIFEQMLALEQQHVPVDILVLRDRLQGAGLLEEIGGMAYLSSLPDHVPVTTNLSSYALLVKQKAVLRRLLEASTEISERVLSSEGEYQELLEYAEKAIFQVTQTRATSSFHHISKVLEATFAHIERLYERREAITGIPTGLNGLDRMLYGLQNSDLLILAARPAMGKTAFALNIAQHAALRAGVTVAVFSLEMSKEQLVMRMLTSEAKVDAGRVKTGNLEDSDWQLLIKAAERLYDAQIYIDDTPGLGIHELRAKVRRLKQDVGLGLLVVDYLQLMSGSTKTNSREQEISEISRGLKGIAKELNIPVIALSQLNRSLESRTDKRPMMSDLRESGAIEQDADIIMFIYRDWVYKRKESPELENDEELKRKAEIIIGKHRSGATGTVFAVFLGEYSSFVNPAEEFQDG